MNQLRWILSSSRVSQNPPGGRSRAGLTKRRPMSAVIGMSNFDICAWNDKLNDRPCVPRSLAPGNSEDTDPSHSPCRENGSRVSLRYRPLCSTSTKMRSAKHRPLRSSTPFPPTENESQGPNILYSHRHPRCLRLHPSPLMRTLLTSSPGKPSPRRLKTTQMPTGR